MKGKTFWGLLLSCSLLGCASAPKYYPNSYEKNLTVNLRLSDQGGALTTVEASAGINDMASDCSSRYQGSVMLSPGANRIGLKPGQTTYLLVRVSHGRFGQRSDFARGTLVTPLAGKQYEVSVNYANDMFDLRFYEVGKAGRKELPLVLMSACRPSKT